MRDDIRYYIALAMSKGLSCKHQRELIRHAKSAQAVFEMDAAQLAEILGCKFQTAIKSILDKEAFEAADREIDFLVRNKVEALCMLDKEYPQRLNQEQCQDTPALIYYKGHADLNAKHVVSIVGTRKATSYGQAETIRIAQQLKNDSDLLVVSGLAYGIDTAAHKASMDNQIATVGILGHGLMQLYPAQNKLLARNMVESNGGLITEYPSDALMRKENFPARNRIIAAMSDATIVVEAAAKGGALITANMANGYGRELFAVPGRLDDTYSEGCIDLLCDGKAHAFRNASDLYEWMGWQQKRTAYSQQLDFETQAEENLAPAEREIVEQLKATPEATIDEIVKKSTLSLPQIATALLSLELKKKIICLAGKKYKLI